MKTYRPGQVPDNPAQLPGFLRQETSSLQRAANAAEPFAELQTLHAAPSKVREGMVAKADGVDWDPGYGAGLYVYIGDAWVLLSSSSLSLSVATTELQHLVFLGQEQLRQLTKIALLLQVMSGLPIDDNSIEPLGTQASQLANIAAILSAIGGVQIDGDQLEIPTF